MDVWMVFDLLPTGPVEAAGRRLRTALKAVPPEVAGKSVPKLTEVLDRVDAGEVTVAQGLAEWLYSLDVPDRVKGEIGNFVSVVEAHPRAVEAALAPVLGDIRTLLG